MPCTLESVLVWEDDALGCQQHDADVKPERPVLDISDVSSYTLFHLPKFLGLASVTCHLCPARNTWLREMANHVLVDERAVNLGMVEHVRSWTYQTHITLQYIEELWELINIGLTHKVTEGKLTWVDLGSLHLVCILVHMHGAELQAIECITIETCSCLLEEDRSWTLKLDAESDDRDEWQHAEAYHTTYQNIEGAFDSSVCQPGERLLAVGIYRLAHELLRVEVQLVFTELSWQIIEVNHVLVAELHNLDDLFRVFV